MSGQWSELKPRKRIRLSWERTKLRNLKATLDAEYSKTLTGRQKLTAANVRQSDEVSPRLAPKESPSWAVRS